MAPNAEWLAVVGVDELEADVESGMGLGLCGSAEWGWYCMW